MDPFEMSFPLNPIDITLDRKLSTSVMGERVNRVNHQLRPDQDRQCCKLFETRPDRQQRFDAVPRGPFEKALVC